ncbi:MAG: hypothetical protein RMM17_10275 [Acidobacteriota bacterium]|nr:hypothetical protein [Blastocatellia bacterium]MDW8413055.1 hypothetical protein [Acidobacteriota bacterium]
MSVEKAKSKKTNKKASPVVTEKVKQTPIELFKGFASKSLYFGLGLGSYIFDPAELNKQISFKKSLSDNLSNLVNSAIDRGQKLEKEQFDRLMRFEREQLNRIKELINARRVQMSLPQAKLEEKIEEVIAGLDLPTRQDIERINRRLDNLARQLARQNSETAKKKTGKEVDITQPASEQA